MRETATFRGQPLLVLAGVLCAWFGLRVALWQPSLAGAGPEAARLAGASAHGRARPPADAGDQLASIPAGPALLPAPITFGQPDWTGSLPARAVMSVTRAPALLHGDLPPTVHMIAADTRPGPVRLAVGHSLLLAAGLSQMELPSALTAYLHGTTPPRAGVPAAAPLLAGLPQHAPPFAGSLLSADAWLMVRQDATSSVVSGRPSYGRSQAGGVVRYRLAPSSPLGPQAYLRVSSALEGALERDLVAGLSARPVPRAPLRFAAEARMTETETGIELRPAVLAVTEFLPLGLPLGMRVEAYLQGGYVAGRFATAFVDGQGRVERAVARLGETEIAAGAGMWGGAQEGAARLDVGPTAAISFRLGEGRGRVAADYRFRLAGDAAPRSGPAVTLSAGF